MVYQVTQSSEMQHLQQNVGIPERAQTLPYRESHKRLGNVQMRIGSLCVILSTIGLIVGYDVYDIFALNYTGVGIYTGVFYIVAGLLGFFAYRFNSEPLVIACMIVNIIAALVTCIGLVFLCLQITRLSYTSMFQRVKCATLIICCSIQLITTIVHASFSCASSCKCCLPRETIPFNVTPLVSAQSLPGTTSTPCQVRQQLPQQEPEIMQQRDQNTEQASHNNPTQQFDDISPQENNMPGVHVQQEASHLPYNQIWPYNPSEGDPPPNENLPFKF